MEVTKLMNADRWKLLRRVGWYIQLLTVEHCKTLTFNILQSLPLHNSAVIKNNNIKRKSFTENIVN